MVMVMVRMMFCTAPEEGEGEEERGKEDREGCMVIDAYSVFRDEKKRMSYISCMVCKKYTDEERSKSSSCVLFRVDTCGNLIASLISLGR